MQATAIDPTRSEDVRQALQVCLDARPELGGARVAGPLEANGEGFDTYIYFFNLEGEALRAEWRGPLVLRILPSPLHDERARRESAVQRFVAEAGYPAPTVLAWDGVASPIGLAYMIMPRVPGEMMLTLMTRRPWTMRSHLRSLGVLQARLHRLPVAGVPLPYDGPLIRTRLAEGRDEALAKGLRREFEWLEQHSKIVEEETPVLTHNDVHPLNVLIDSDGTPAVIDWSDARLGDRHHDVGRTAALFWIASIAAKSTPERLFLRAMRGRMVRWHQDGYRTQLPLQSERLTYWQAFHALSGLMMVRALHEDHDDPAIKDSSRERVPASLADELLQYFWARARSLG